MPRIHAVINQGSGADRNRDEVKSELDVLFEAYNLDAKISIAESGEHLLKLAEQAAQSDAEIICAGGGDGTMSAVAAQVFKTKKTLGVLPLGTLNHFSKDLKIPQDLAEAVKIIAANHTQMIDAAEVNGQIFVNNSSIGVYPQIVKIREFQQKHLGRSKWAAAFSAALTVLEKNVFFRVKLEIEGKNYDRRTPFVFVGNNEYKMNFLDIGTRDKLDDGLLSVYLLHKSNRRGLLMLIIRAALGRLREAEDFEEINTPEITIETHRKQILVAFDGEVKTMQTPLYYKIYPQSLRVIVPAEKN